MDVFLVIVKVGLVARSMGIEWKSLLVKHSQGADTYYSNKKMSRLLSASSSWFSFLYFYLKTMGNR